MQRRSPRSQSSRRHRRGLVAVEDLLSIAAVLGCFVIPVAIAARTAGTRIIAEMDRMHEQLVKQP